MAFSKTVIIDRQLLLSLNTHLIKKKKRKILKFIKAEVFAFKANALFETLEDCEMI